MSETKYASAGTVPSTGRETAWRCWILTGIGILGCALLLGTGHIMDYRMAIIYNQVINIKTPNESIGSNLREAFSNINHAMLWFHLLGNDSDKDMLDHGIQAFTRMQAQNLSRTTNFAERAVLRKISDAFSQYLKDTRDLSAQSMRAIRRDSISQAQQTIEQASATLWPLINHLAEIQHHISSQMPLALAASMSATQSVLNGIILAWLLLAVLAAWVIDRYYIAPMRGRMMRNETAAERQERMASLGVLAAGVAHEIRNPLAAIKCRLFSLKKELPDSFRENEDMAVIQSEINRLDRIVKDFLLFARPSEPALEVLQAQSVVIEIHNLLQAQLGKKAIELTMDLGDPAWIRADKQQIQQALINLVQNAADSIECGGKITMRIKTGIAKLEKRAASMVVIEVADSGKGISPDDEKRIFDPFFSTKDTGTGLGLPITARIIEKHGGFMQYQTQQNRGTTFSLMLPRMEKDAQSTLAH